jgi:trimeric autotransporter adhesin
VNGRRLALCTAALVLGAVALSACTTSRAGQGVRPTIAGGTDPAASDNGQSSSIFERGADVRVTVTAAVPTRECSTLARDLSGSGDFWTTQYEAPQDPPLSMVCIMTNRGYSAEVDDDGGQFRGQSVCSGFVQAGWTEDQAAEQQRSALAASAAASASSASASAAASAARQQQLSQEVTALASAYGAVGQDASAVQSDQSAVADDVATTNDDVKTAYTDEQAVLKDAQTASNNQDGTTCGDASTSRETLATSPAMRAIWQATYKASRLIFTLWGAMLETCGSSCGVGRTSGRTFPVIE